MISAVIPALNAEAHLARALASLAGGAAEIVVADGGSTDGTAEIARAAGARLIVSAPGRGPQLRAGAAAARGPFLLFLHADTALSPGWEAAANGFIQEAGEAERAAAFAFALDADDDWRARLLERCVAARCAAFGLPYGDQGLLISRSFYDALGGYAPIPLFEDVELARRIGRARLTMLAPRAVTSAAAWRRDGYLRRSARNLGLLGRYLAGADPARLAGAYRRAG